MSDNTTIGWTDATWNPVIGCTRVSEECLNCYAERDAGRKNYNPLLPIYKGIAEFRGQKPHRVPRWTGVVRVVEHHMTDPLKWRRPRRIFVNSMSDLFHEKLAFRDVARVVRVMQEADWHTYQVLTKRADRMLEFVRWWKMQTLDDLPSNLWLGVSAGTQKAADERIPLLLQTPAAVRFVSAEPLLERIDLSAHAIPALFGPNKLHWVIVGAESGPGARPMDEDWVRFLRDQTVAAGAKFFYKQDAIKGKKIEAPMLDGRQWLELPEARHA